MPEIISRAEAKAKGLKLYFTGRPCLRGHVSQRSVNQGCLECKSFFAKGGNGIREKLNLEKRTCQICKEFFVPYKTNQILCGKKLCKKELNKLFSRRRRAENPELVNFHQHISYMKNAKKRNMEHKAWREKNAEKLKKSRREQYAKIKDLLAVLRTTMPDLLKEFGL